MLDQKKAKRTRPEVYSRVVGYLRPVQQWNEGKAEEFKDRKIFNVSSEKSKEKEAFPTGQTSQKQGQEEKEALTPAA